MPAVLALADVEVMPAVLRLVMVRGHTIAFATCATIVFTFVCDAVKTNPTNEDVQVRAGPGANAWPRVPHLKGSSGCGLWCAVCAVCAECALCARVCLSVALRFESY